MKVGFLESLKVWWSYTWRAYVLIISGLAVVFVPFGFLFLGIRLLVLHHVFQLTPIAIALITFLMTVLLLPIILYLGILINYWVINQLTKITYHDFRLVLMIDDRAEQFFGKFDCLCVLWSVGWRGIIVESLAIPVITGLTFFAPLFYSIEHVGLSVLPMLIVPLSFSAYVLISLILYMLPIHWMLNRKRTGRYLMVVRPTTNVLEFRAKKTTCPPGLL